MPFIPSYADYAAERWQRRKAPIYGAFSLAENAADSAQSFAEFQQNAEAEFLCPYMGLFWSEATPVFSKSVGPLTRLLKNDTRSPSLLNFGNLRNFSKNGNASSSGVPRCLPPVALERAHRIRCVTVGDGQIRNCDIFSK